MATATKKAARVEPKDTTAQRERQAAESAEREKRLADAEKDAAREKAAVEAHRVEAEMQHAREAVKRTKLAREASQETTAAQRELEQALDQQLAFLAQKHESEAERQKRQEREINARVAAAECAINFAGHKQRQELFKSLPPIAHDMLTRKQNELIKKHDQVLVRASADAEQRWRLVAAITNAMRRGDPSEEKAARGMHAIVDADVRRGEREAECLRAMLRALPEVPFTVDALAELQRIDGMYSEFQQQENSHAFRS